MSQGQWRETLKQGLQGSQSHFPPARLLEADPQRADHKWPGLPYSARECLYHTMIWSEIVTEVLVGGVVSWPQHLDETWQVPEELRLPSGWQKMASRLQDAIQRASEHLDQEQVDMESPVAGWPKATVGSACQVMITHNSYHLGQLAVLLRLLGAWPDRA